jgi:undecaprenyl-diphosphatase
MTFLETSVFIGLMVPGEMTVILAGFFAASGALRVLDVIWWSSLGAFLGDITGYLIGRYGGIRLALRFGKFIFLREREIEKVKWYFRRHGGKTIFFGRFTSFLRAFAPFVAGMIKMRPTRFLFYDMLGAICWAGFFTFVGFFFEEGWERVERWIGRTSLIALGLAVFIILIHRKLLKKRSS